MRRDTMQNPLLHARLAHQPDPSLRQVSNAAMQKPARPTARSKRKSRASTKATFIPRNAASRAIPAPTIPPPMTKTSKRSFENLAWHSERCISFAANDPENCSWVESIQPRLDETGRRLRPLIPQVEARKQQLSLHFS